MLHLYNSLTKMKEPFVPLEPHVAKFYVCGPTVYDHPHIGHARSAYVFEVMRRYLTSKGFRVFFVRNVTDIDDKIINKAVQDLKEKGMTELEDHLKKEVAAVSIKYYESYQKAMEHLGLLPPDAEPKATEYIGKIIGFIAKLIQKGNAYVSGGDVYFDVGSFPEYGLLSGQDKNELLEGTRINPDERKRDSLDFALWKSAKPNEPAWDSPWGKGRPGWHIECSVMSTDILGSVFDIHGGGLDLIFPHHENEIAQSKAATGGMFAKYWVHNGFLTVAGEKMSKSLGNFVTVDDFLKQYKDADLLKILFLSSHYRSPVNYTEEKMQEGASSKKRIMIFIDKAERLGKDHMRKDEIKENEELLVLKTKITELSEKYESAMDDDFNTPGALSVIFEAVRIGNEALLGNSDDEIKAHSAAMIKNFIIDKCKIFGLDMRTRKEEKDSERIDKLVQKRAEARINKDFKAADEIRHELDALGVTVEDTPKGPVWRRK
ncbi:MAG: cysteine--tRNA ligase [Candidatus Omnitrophica bacterium]|nr:cysteine--tRNA ligase [Candidatus Omnitrophota bacterium]